MWHEMVTFFMFRIVPFCARLQPMNRFELIGKIVEELIYQDEDTLRIILAMCAEELTDDTINVVTYGKDDTEHIMASSDIAPLIEDIQEVKNNHTIIMPKLEQVAYVSVSYLER